MSRKGQISVQTNNIFPIIKKWLYSEHDIFLRELVSNSCDAITKRARLATTQNQEIPQGKVTVEIDKNNKTISISDNGLGMDEGEVEKYLAELAFSGAAEFVEKMKGQSGDQVKNDIIGKFGLGFYSAFMVADEVQVESLSMKDDAKAIKWVCQGETEYEFSESTRTEIGTTVTLKVSEESAEFLEGFKTREVLRRYCGFMPYPIELKDLNWIEKTKEENAKAEKEEDKKPLGEDLINETKPLWKKDPTQLKDEDYKNFYNSLFPMDPPPLFWLHLNVDHPFELQGILYFPKLNPQKIAQENSIRLYSKQVFVSDNVKNIIPEFLGLLKGAIDSPDIPLNVSRSSLQGDPNIKKISNYVVKKVAESLKKLFNNDRKRFEEVWPDIGLFVKYGCVSDTKFDELAQKLVVFPSNLEKFLTVKEYTEAIPADFKEKLKEKVIFFEKGKSDLSLVKKLTEQKIPAIEIDSYIDPHFTQHTEMKPADKEQKLKFCSVDEEYENLFGTDVSEEEVKKIQTLFEAHLPKSKDDKEAANEYAIEVKGIKEASSAAYLKVDQSMKRFQQMTQSMGQSSFSMPLKKTLVVNPLHPLVQNLLKLQEKGQNEELVQDLCHQVQDLAAIGQEGLEDNERIDFISRSQSIMERLGRLALE